MSMSATENGEPMAEALVEQPGGGAADGVMETEDKGSKRLKGREW